MNTLDWTTIAATASTVALVMSGFLWFATKIFNLGKTSQRLDTIEADVASLKQDFPRQIQGLRTELSTEINAVRTDLNLRMDKLILTIANSKK